MKNFLKIIVSGFVLVCASISAAAQTSGGSYAITNSVIGGGGGRTEGGTGAGNYYTVNGSIGQSVAADPSTGNNPTSGSSYSLRHGFWSEILAPTAANVRLSGRVVTASGRGVKGAIVTLTGSSLTAPVSFFTNARGQFYFDDVPGGQTFILTVQRDNYVFQQSYIVVSTNATQTDLIFKGQIQ